MVGIFYVLPCKMDGIKYCIGRKPQAALFMDDNKLDMENSFLYVT